MKALPRPERGGSLDLLRNHVRLSDDGFTLLLAFLVQCLRPVGPYPILELTGEQGSGKSTAAKMIRALVDPSHIPIRTRPRKERDLVIAAENAWALAFDNMSGVQPWLSDALCRLSTGGGFGTRKLYADREEEIFYARRPMILNGINRLAGRSDLADRAIRLELEAIPEAERRTEADVWADFEQDRPRIIGALFGAVSTALQCAGNVELERLPRMADFARWAVAAEPAFPSHLNTNPGGESAFLDAYESNREEASEEAVEADTVSACVRAMLDDEKRHTPGEWMGTTTELMEDLRGYLPDPKDPPKDYPSTHQAMTARLKRIMPDLRAVGIEREEQKRKSGSRAFRLCKTDTGGGQIDSRGKTASPASSRHETGSASSDGRSAMTRHDAPPPAASSPASFQKRPTGHTDAHDDAHDAHDAVLGPQSNGASFEHGDRVATPDGEGEVIEVTESGRVVVRHDDDCFGESTRPFDTEQIKEVN
jgi:energy-coupling factor transporter ATP-binding protein EcfA2